MYSILVFLITFSEVATALISYALDSKIVFYNAVVYGSPFHLMMTLFGRDSAFLDQNPLYIGLFVGHILKYFLFFMAQFKDDSNLWRTLAIVLEAAYLGLSAYYII